MTGLLYLDGLHLFKNWSVLYQIRLDAVLVVNATLLIRNLSAKTHFRMHWILSEHGVKRDLWIIISGYTTSIHDMWSGKWISNKVQSCCRKVVRTKKSLPQSRYPLEWIFKALCCFQLPVELWIRMCLCLAKYFTVSIHMWNLNLLFLSLTCLLLCFVALFTRF